MDSTRVGPTSVGVLLEDAQRLAWDLLEQRRDVGSSTLSHEAVVHAAGRVRTHAAAWPVLAAAGAHALRSAPVLDSVERRRGESLAQLLDRLARRGVPVAARGAEGDVRMLTIARHLGAVGDLLEAAGRTPGRTPGRSLGRAPEGAPGGAGGDVSGEAARDALAVRDKVAAVLEVAAAASLGYADVATGLTTRAPGWGRLVEATYMQSRDLMVTAASERAGRFDDVAATAAGDRDGGRAGVVSRWARVSASRLTLGAASSQALALVANDAAMVSRTAVRVLDAGMAAGVVDPAVGRPAVDAMVAAAAEWKATATHLLELRLGGRPDSEQLRASLDLGSRMQALGHDRTSLQDPRDLAELGGEMRRAAGVCTDLATRLEETVCGLVSTGGFAIPAVVALRSVRPAPTEWLQPAARRGWVPARVDLPQVAALTGAVGRVAEAAQTADELTVRTATMSGGPGHHAHAAGAASLSPGYRQVPVAAAADAEATEARDIAATGKRMTDQPGSSDRRADGRTDTRPATGHPRTPSPRQAPPPHAPGRRG